LSTQHGQGVGRLLEQIFAGHQVVDLSLPLAEGMPYTAPRHFMPSNGTMEQLPLLAAAGPACVVDVTGLDAAEAGASPRITPRHLERWEAEHGAIDAGDVVLLRGGWDGHYLPGPPGRRYDDALVSQTAPGWPAPTQEAIDWLRTRGVRCVGTDGFSIGPADDDAAAHLAALPHGMTFVEALAGLRLLPPRGAWFLFLPIRLAGGSGSPGRALAVLPDSRQDQEGQDQEGQDQEGQDQEAEHEAA
jgi:kynurenine formamidase